MKTNNNLSTIDLREKKKFERYYNEWWDLTGPFNPLHAFNEIRINFIKKTVCSLENSQSYHPFKGLSILDIGCGGGILCEPLKRLGAKVSGIDTSTNAIEIAKKHAKKSKLQIKYFNCELENFNNIEKFDLILCMEVLEHINNIDIFINDIKKRLKPSGYLIGSTISKTLNSYINAIILAEKFLNLIPKGTHQWNKFITPNNLKKILLKKKFKNIDFFGSKYNPVLKQWNYCDSLKVNYFFHART